MYEQNEYGSLRPYASRSPCCGCPTGFRLPPFPLLFRYFLAVFPLKGALNMLLDPIGRGDSILLDSSSPQVARLAPSIPLSSSLEYFRL